MQYLKNIIRHAFPMTVLVTLLCGVIYIVGQQGYRHSANDPQIQMAQDTARAVESGIATDTLVSTTKVDVGQSLAPFLVIFDEKGAPVAGNGILHGRLPNLPGGVFDYTRGNSEDRLTWQPEPGVRHAIVVERINGAKPGYVMAGKSLREVEQRVDQLTLLVGAGWVGVVIATLVTIVLIELVFRGKKQ